MIEANCTVVLRSHSDYGAQVQILKAAADQKMGKSRVSLKDIVGHSYGTVFELCQRKYFARALQIDREGIVIYIYIICILGYCRSYKMNITVKSKIPCSVKGTFPFSLRPLLCELGI